MRMGLPRVLTTDQGREFQNKLDKEIMMKLLGFKQYCTTPYHPQVINVLPTCITCKYCL